MKEIVLGENGQNVIYFPAKYYLSIHFCFKGVYTECSQFKYSVSIFLAVILLLCCEEVLLSLYRTETYIWLIFFKYLTYKSCFK